MPLLPEDDTVVCPYNKAHEILKPRYAHHLLKCRKQHPNSGLDICVFNSTHHIPKEEMALHLRSCPDKIRPNVSSVKMSYVPPCPNANVRKLVTSNENWDCDPGVVFDPRINAMKKNVVRSINNVPKSERIAFRWVDYT